MTEQELEKKKAEEKKIMEEYYRARGDTRTEKQRKLDREKRWNGMYTKTEAEQLIDDIKNDRIPLHAENANGTLTIYTKEEAILSVRKRTKP